MLELVKTELEEYAQGIRRALDDCPCDHTGDVCISCHHLSLVIAKMRLLLQVLQVQGDAKS